MNDADQGRILLRNVLEVPADDTARLVYADWLEEHGDAERAEFVRIQVRTRQGESFPQSVYDREYELLERNWRRWLGDCHHVKRQRPWLSDYYEPAINFQWRRMDRFDLGNIPIVQVLFYRGFALNVTSECEWWLDRGDWMIENHPVEHVEFTNRPDDTDRLNEFALHRKIEDGEPWRSYRWPAVEFAIPRNHT